MMEVILAIVLIGLGIWVSRLSERVARLEYLGRRERASNSSKKSSTKGKKQEPHTEVIEEDEVFPWEEEYNRTHKISNKGLVSSMAKDLLPTNKSSAPKKEFHLEEFLGKKLFPILGVTSIVLAIGFFALWAFSNGWVGPMGRIALGVLFSVVLLVIGELTRPKYPQFFYYLSAAGIAGLIVMTFITRYHYEFISSLESLILYSLEFGAGVFLSLRYKSRVLGNFSILTGLAAPLLTNSNDGNIIGLLGFLTLVSFFGFILASYKKWPEIFIVLLFAIIGFEILSIDTFIRQPEKITPVMLLGFIATLHILIGSGGIVRLFLTNQKQSIKKVDKSDVYEILLLGISLIIGNLLAFNIFDHLGWEHFGFVVGAQALILYFLAEWFKSKKWKLFHLAALGSSLTFILFATFWELQNNDAVILTLTMIGEGVLMSFIGQASRQKMFDVFGRIAFCIAFISAFQITDMLISSVTIITLILALGYSVKNTKDHLDKIWLSLALFFSSIHVFNWSFEILKRELPEDLIFLVLVTPIAWGLSICFLSLKVKSQIARIAGLLIILLINLLYWNQFSDYESFPQRILALALTLSANFIGLSSFFVVIKNVSIPSWQKLLAIYTALGISTMSVFLYGLEYLDEPIRSIFWMAWGGLLLIIGSVNNWARFRYFGLGTFLFIVAKLYFVDVWQWEVWVRFLAFLALGVALLSIGFFYQKTWSKK